MNTKTQEALKMVIEYLTNIQLDYKGHEVRKACKEALAQPAQEPVAWRSEGGVLTEAKLQAQSWVSHGGKAIPLYTHPAPSWQGLSDDEIFDLHHKWIMSSGNKDTQYDFARAIEQALKEKNT